MALLRTLRDLSSTRVGEGEILAAPIGARAWLGGRHNVVAEEVAKGSRDLIEANIDAALVDPCLQFGRRDSALGDEAF